MQREIERNKKRFGEENVKYVFVNKKNKRISVNTINKHMQRKLKENNVLGRDGKILSCTTHQFRATLATNLIATGPEVLRPRLEMLHLRFDWILQRSVE